MACSVDRVRATCAHMASASELVHIGTPDTIAKYADTIMAKGIQRGPTQPTSLQGSLLVNYTFLRYALEFGGGWRVELTKHTGRGASQTISHGVDTLMKAGNPLTAASLSPLSSDQLAVSFGVPVPVPEEVAPFVSLLHRCVALLLEDLKKLEMSDFAAYWTALLGGRDRLSCVELVDALERDFRSLQDVATCRGQPVYFLKKAQVLTYNLSTVLGPVLTDVQRLTIFVDNVIPFVLWQDGILNLKDEIAARITAHQPFAYGEEAEVELRACALTACERICEASGGALTAADLDFYLWSRGKDKNLRPLPRHCVKDTFLY
eukprot:NODE_4180_length_1104_cov_28.176351_g3982_i0.p1 GENE.NODE_4180_length_1104_cov_28.176351_g3982_i0~~NODE_4180_length_1104_cov_28.176351_g3982_i0.p1  ORF type:complete len:320 (-),score=48.11 NODE_4180_length_1104_cov_28.176351_g3982_i0:39-998(-)